LGPTMNGIEAMRRIKEVAPRTRVLVLTMFTDPGTVAEAVKAGADGYMSKGSSREAVVQALRDVNEGRSMLDPNVTEGIFGRISGKDPYALSDRERRVLEELSHGKSTREIGESLDLSEGTVRTYLKQILRKLGVHDRTQWNDGFRDPRDSMVPILALGVAVVLLIWSLWRSGVLG
jgi:two-component system NarL family response regulator